MATTTMLRPSSLSSGVGWTPSSGTLYGVTSDNSDATYAAWGGSGSALILGTPLDSPPAGERRHQVRLRARGEDGDAWWAVQLSSGALVAGAAASFTASPGTVTGSWGFGAPADGSTILYTYVTGQSTGLKIEELYIDVDTRSAPTFTAQVLDGTGSVTTTVSDTAQPSFRANAVDLDGLAARQFRYWVTLNGAIVWDTGVTGGSALTQQTTTPLDNGSYVAHYQVWSTLGSNTAYASDEETVSFTVSVGDTPAPDNPDVTPVDGTPFYQLEACAPYTGEFDDGTGWLEVQRVDCPIGGSLLLNGVSGSDARAPSTAPFTDLEVTVRAGRDDSWTPSSDQTLAAKYNSAGNNRGFIFGLHTDGTLYLTWSPDGLFVGSQITAYSTAAPTVDSFGNATLRVFLDVNDGAGGYALTFDQQDTVGDWHQIGDIVTNSGGGTTAVYQNGQNLEAGARNDGLSERWVGRVYSAQFRNGPAGSVLASPDFTGHAGGTMSFTDDQGNTWTVYGTASIVSDQRLVSIAMLGPLETGECATYTDYTLPRTGVGLTCTHQPDPCCSYYRARTVGRIDGQLQISSWSDAYNPAVPHGVIMMWPGTNALIPAGWGRVTELDAKYPKGIASSITEPGTTGGAATHLHTTPNHTHDTSHVHTITGDTSAATTSFNSTPNSAGTTAVFSSHTHTRPSTNSTTMTAAFATPSSATASNDPARLEVIFVQSDGTGLGVPNGALGLAADVSLSGWTDYANATGRFLKGAAAAGNGGATAASSANSHTHTVDAHTHAGTNHVHTSASTGAFVSNHVLTAGATAALNTGSHSHPITVGATVSQALASASGGSSGAAGADLRPPFLNTRVKENTSGGVSLPVGLIGLWRRSLGLIPDFWRLCDGTGGTPNLTAVYPLGATSSIGTTGGSLAGHTHTGGSHTHTTTGHSHTETIGSAATATTNVSTTATVATTQGTHIHTAADTNSTTPTVTSAAAGTLASTTVEPPFEEVAFIQLVETPTPPPDPELFCLTWDDDEQLLRTEGPDGPLWVAVGGEFTWDVDRPFTSAVGVNGGRYITSSPPGGRNLHMTVAVENEAELAQLQAVLNRPLVLVSPSDSDEVWAAPVAASVRIVKIGRVRQVSADFIATGPQPEPQLADVG